MCGIPLWLLVYGTGALLAVLFLLAAARAWVDWYRPER